MIIQKYQTSLDSNDILLKLRDQKYLMFLDSSKFHKKFGRYSILVCNPIHVLKSKNKEIFWDDNLLECEDPFEVLQEKLDLFKQIYKSDLPFIGGFVGFFGYDLKAFIEKLPAKAEDDIKMPDLFLGLYPGGLVIDHLEKVVYLTDADIDHRGNERIEAYKSILESKKSVHKIQYEYSKGPVTSNFTKDDYLIGIQKVKDYIRSGDIYQANFTQRFSCPIQGHPFDLYQELRKNNPAPFSSYIDFGTGHICSSSPERFIEVRNGIIQTRPIKGTMPRYKDPVKDEESKNMLINSKKDQSELLMIVDLERNDLSKIAQTGTVKVPELFKLESYETVHHLVATVEANIDPSYSVTDLIKATFPGGSITGTPKIRAMEVIDELEPTARALYTGSIGYIDFNQNLDLNIVIRTFICKDNQAYFQAGGGIVWDSSLEAEYQESLDKAIALKNTLIGDKL